MSNLNEEDIVESQETKGLFEVRLQKIPVFNQETGEEIRTDKQYTVCNKVISSENYPCYDERTARELCETLNNLTMDYNLDKSLPEPKLSNEVTELAHRINSKQTKLHELQNAIQYELSCELAYNKKCNDIKLHPDKVKEALELSKNPTEKQITAFCEEQFEKEFTYLKIAKTNTSLINKQIDLINDYISLERYILRMALK